MRCEPAVERSYVLVAFKQNTSKLRVHARKPFWRDEMVSMFNREMGTGLVGLKTFEMGSVLKTSKIK